MSRKRAISRSDSPASPASGRASSRVVRTVMSARASDSASSTDRKAEPTLSPRSHSTCSTWPTTCSPLGVGLPERTNSRSRSENGASTPRPYPPTASSDSRSASTADTGHKACVAWVQSARSISSAAAA